MKKFSEKPSPNSEFNKQNPSNTIKSQQNATRKNILKIISLIAISTLAYQQVKKTNATMNTQPQNPSPTPQFNFPNPKPYNLPKGKPAPEPFFKNEIPAYQSKIDPNHRYT